MGIINPETRNDADHLQSASFFFFWIGAIAGAGALGVGIWIILDRAYIDVMIGSTTITASAWILTLSGGIAIVAMFIGDVGVCIPHSIVMWIYVFTQGFVFMCFIIAAILAGVFKVHINKNEAELITKMKGDLRDEYGINPNDGKHSSLTQSWDDTQTKLRCCAVEDENWGAYLNSEWYLAIPPVPGTLVKPYVPKTCCTTEIDWSYKDSEMCQTFQYGPPRQTGGQINHALYYRGCLQAAKDMGNETCDIIIALAVVLGFIMILPPLLLAIWLVLKGMPKIENIQAGKKDAAEKQMMYPTEGATNFAGPAY